MIEEKRVEGLDHSHSRWSQHFSRTLSCGDFFPTRYETEGSVPSTAEMGCGGDIVILALGK